MRLSLRRLLTILTVGLLVPMAVPLSVAADDTPDGIHSDNMSHVANLAYENRYGQTIPYGTDVEFASIAQRRVSGRPGPLRDYAFAGTYRNGLQIIDITNPEAPRIAAVYDCAMAQGDVQVFKQGKRTLVAYTADDISRQTFPASRCYAENGVTTKKYGTFFIDVSVPTNPKTVGFAEVDAGSHNTSIHPGGQYMYNSNSDLLPKGIVSTAIEIFDIRDPANPVKVGELDTLPGLESHDITFSEDGTRAYSASLDSSVIIDSSNPRAPRVITEFVDPAINIHHQADPVTITDPVLGTRKFLVITDELAGAIGTGTCPGGGLHVYDITGDLEKTPLKVGFFDIGEVRLAPDGAETGDRLDTCTSHVLRMYPDQKLMTIAWYNAGVRVIDISQMVGASLGGTGTGMREIGFYRFAAQAAAGSRPTSDTWSFKTNKIEADGSFYGYGNDIARGFDVFRFDASAQEASENGAGGRWLSPTQVAREAEARGTVPTSEKRLICLLPGRQ